MATISTVGIAITASTSALTQGLTKARAQLAAFSSSVGSMGSSAMSSMAGLAPMASTAGLAIGAGMLAGAGWGVKLAAESEQAKVSFEVMLGSVGKANTMIADLKQAAAATPFEFTDLQQGAKTLLAFGIEGQKVLPTLNMLGDVSGGDAEKMKSLATTFGQISSAGKLTGGDLLQLINVGFNPLQEMAERTGKSVTDLKKDMEAGKISFQMVEESFKRVTSEGGRYHGMMAKQSQTMMGMWATLNDSIATEATKIGETLIGAFDMKGGIERISAFIDQAGAAFQGFTPYIIQFGNVVASGFTMVMEIGGEVGKFWSELFASWGITATTTAETLREVLFSLEFSFTNWRDVLSLAFDQTSLRVVKFVNDVSFFFTTTIPSVLTAFGENWRLIFSSVFEQTVSNWKAMWTALANFELPKFDFSPMTEGLSQAFKDVKLDREATSMEKMLEEQIATKSMDLGKKYLEFDEKKRKEFAENSKPKEEVKEALTGAVGPSLFGQLKDQFTGAAGALSKVKLPERKDPGATGAMRAGSAEAFSAIQARNRAKDPQQTLVEQGKAQLQSMQELVQLTKAQLGKAGQAMPTIDSFL